MARPNKNNAEYFSHDNSMRNHRKIKALRQEFGAEGYNSYCMLLETLTASENFEFTLKKEMEWKMLASDFGIETEKLKQIISLMEELELIQSDNGLISCESLSERMQPLLDKRIKSKELASNLHRNDNGQFSSNRSRGVSVAETPQSKVKESKVKESKEKKRNNKVNIIEETSCLAKQSFADTEHLKNTSKEIQEILNIFYEINPTLNFANTTQRKAIDYLIGKFGFEETLNTTKYATSIQGKKYAPTITTPLELKNNMGKLLIYYKREQEPIKGAMPIFKF